MNSGTLNCGIRNCNSKDWFQKFFWNISEAFCDIILKGTLVAGFTFISLSLRLARNKNANGAS